MVLKIKQISINKKIVKSRSITFNELLYFPSFIIIYLINSLVSQGYFCQQSGHSCSGTCPASAAEDSAPVTHK